MEFVRLTVGEFETNGYIVRVEQDAVLIDPGAEPERFVRQLEQWNVTPAAILLTHGHGDHIGAVRELRERYPEAEVICHPGDAPMLRDPRLNLSAEFGLWLDAGAPTRTVADGEELHFGELTLRVMLLPGHTRGHVVFYHADGHVFAGDTLFAGGVGRWDFPGGDGELLLHGIRDKLLALPPETHIHPGHGPSTTVHIEARTNPYLDPEFLKMMGGLE